MPPTIKFELGQIVLTKGVAGRAAQDPEFDAFVIQSIAKHSACDWGDIPPKNVILNNLALGNGSRIQSAYKIENMPRIWIITSANRSITTILFPNED